MTTTTHPSFNRVKRVRRPKRLERLERVAPGMVVAICHRTSIADPEAPGGHRRAHVEAFDVRLGKVWIATDSVDLARDVSRALRQRGVTTGAVELVDADSGEIVKRFDLAEMFAEL